MEKPAQRLRSCDQQPSGRDRREVIDELFSSSAWFETIPPSTGYVALDCNGTAVVVDVDMRMVLAGPSLAEAKALASALNGQYGAALRA